MGPVVGRLFSIIKMRAFAFVLLAAAAVVADSDPYTIGQVASGLTHGGVVTGVDYSNGVVSGVGAIGNRAYAGHVGYAGVGHLGYANHVVAAPAAYSGVVAAPSVYSSVVPTTAIHGYAGHYYGKREADSDADAYTIGQVAAGLPVHNAYATGHPHNVGVVTGTTYSAPVHHDTLPMLLLPIPMLLMYTLVFMLMLPQPFMDMLDTTMASVRLILMLMLTPLDRSLLDSLSTTPMLLDTPTMSEL